MAIELIPDDPNSRVPGELVQTDSPGVSKLTGILPPDTYRIRIDGANPTAYRLMVNLTRMPLEPDGFEPNDSFAEATHMVFEPTPAIIGVHGIWGPGKFDATLHSEQRLTLTGPAWVINSDYYQLDVPAISGLAVPTVSIANTDVVLDVELFDSAQVSIGKWTAVRKVDIQPPPNSTYYLVVSGMHETRYTIQVGMKVDKDSLPGPLMVDPYHLPKWWGDPPALRLGHEEHFVTEISTSRDEDPGLRFQGVGGRIKVTLIGMNGEIAREGTNEVSTAGLEPGNYLVRLSKIDSRNKTITVYQVPPRM
jgi:hypothetical protein